MFLNTTKIPDLPKQLLLYTHDATAFYRFMAELPSEAQGKALSHLRKLKYTHKESLHEPHYKFFADRRYKGLVELRIRSSVLIRIILMPRNNDYIILAFFVKQCPRDTITTLERADRVRKKLLKAPYSLVELVPCDAQYTLKSNP